VSSYRIFAGATSGVSTLVLLLTQVVGGPDESAVPDIEPLPTVAPSPTARESAPEPSLPPPSPTTDQPPPEIGTIVYEHDFSSPAGGLLAGQGFETASNQFGTRLAEYTPNGTLLVTSASELDTYVAGANTQDLVVDGRDLSDLAEVSLEVDATPDDIGDAASWGLACRRDREVGRFYYAFIADFGSGAAAGIIRQDEPGGEWVELGSAEIPNGVDIGRGVTNRLRLDCLGSTLTLFVDGQEAVRVTDSTYPSGSVALFVNPIPSDGEASAEVAFDNLVIREA
jgi:hypothetical protein